jgi:NAD(P)-dependent dehydrogenase (short-subunit alcohol dehydrogenase family)
MSTYLVTGAAGFIAARVCELLLADGHAVVGVDNLNDYYDVRLKDYRLSRLLGSRARPCGSEPQVSVYGDMAKPETGERKPESGAPKLAGVGAASGLRSQPSGLRPQVSVPRFQVSVLPIPVGLLS